MNRIQGMTVVVTGASAGIGEACAYALAARGANLVLLARRLERLDRIGAEIRGEHGVEVRTAVLDVRDRSAVDRVGAWLVDQGIEPDVLVNNAGLGRGLEAVHEGDPDDWDEMIDTNVKGLLYVTRAFLPGMIERDRGHVVNIGSIAGRQVTPANNVYNATKFAVRALNEAMNIDLAGTSLRVSSVDPGRVETDFSEVRFHGDADRAKAVYAEFASLSPADVADAVCYVINAPAHVNVHELVLLSTAQRNAYVARDVEG